MITVVDVAEKAVELANPWMPVELVYVNDQVIRIALFHGEYHWHRHVDEDELFYVVKGSIVIQLKDQANITLHQGQVAVVPKGVQHCPKSSQPSYVLML
jgi:mannose-6-phosphate isomerase-like protein (cupin superfamily)